MQGRVFTLIGSAATAVSPIGLIVAGPVADWLGVQSWYVFGGVVTLLLAVAGLFSPAVMGIEDNRDVRTEAQDDSGAAFSDEAVKLG
jgi:DHA3 family macrolide efflux protein-like MFS transporter